MRFWKYQIRKAPREWTPRKLQAAERAVRKDAESVPLFPELRRYESVADRIADVNAGHLAFVLKHRAFRAYSWRRAGRARRALLPLQRKAVDAKWNRGHIPGDPSYLCDIIWCLPVGNSLYL